MPNLATTVADLLARVQRPGSFYSTGTVDIHPPRLLVDGVGPISLPLLATQAEQLVAASQPAPYGRGSETLLDTEVRRTWQIDASRVHISGRRWSEDLSQMVSQVRAELSVAADVEAQLYKLLVYDSGSFFVSHRDTEKAPGMFATLVVVLPSEFSGGELLVRHKGQEVRLDLRRDEPSEAAFAAFYADCRHEVLPIASGHRLALIYNLVRVGPGVLPEPPDYSTEQEHLIDILRAWSAPEPAADAEASPGKLLYPLEHAYSQADLGFNALKGADAAIAEVLTGAAASAGCDLHLALVTIEESGWAEYAGGNGRDDVEYEIGEVTDGSETLHDWRHPDGSRPAMGALPFYGDEISPPDALDDVEDVEPDFEEATGNEGVSFERLYQRAALVLWPRSRRAKVLAEGGIDASLPFLKGLVDRWESNGGEHGDLRWQEARELAVCIRDGWPEQDWARERASKSGHSSTLLDCLSRLGDLDAAAIFLARQAATGAYGPADNEMLTAVLSQLEVEQASELLSAIVTGNLGRQPDACANLLERYSAAIRESPGLLRPAAQALIAGLPNEVDESYSFGSRHPRPIGSGLVADSLSALERVDPALAAQALKHFLLRPGLYSPDDVLLPAALSLTNAGGDFEPDSIKALRQAMLAHLERRIDLPLEPPADWHRDPQIDCGCVHCRELSRFLNSPLEPEWRFKAAEAKRRHLASSIAASRCDLDLKTERKGSPHTLICTKNIASHERRVRQRQQDLKHREALRSAPCG